MALTNSALPEEARGPNSTAPSSSSLSTGPIRDKPEDSGDVEGEEAALSPDDEPSHSKLQLTLIMFALCLAVFLAAIDATVITVALPTITRDLHASNSGYAWIGSAYLLALAASAPFWGKVSDIFGRKPIIIIANIVFMVGSLVSALSHNLTMILAGRAVQGIGGGGLITLVEISVGDMFSQRLVILQLHHWSQLWLHC